MNQVDPIRVLIVDDHAMVRKGLGAFLRVAPDLELVGEAGSGAEALRACAEYQPDVVLMDLVMPEMDGATATRHIRDEYPDIQVIALTSFQEKELVQNAVQAGAISYLLKHVSAEELTEAIRAAHAGRATLAREALQVLTQAATSPPPIGHDLTDREHEVLELLVEGLNNPEIAAQLTVTRSTVKSHVSNILSKLGASNRTEAVTIALQHNLVT